MLISAFAVGALVNLLGSRGKVARAEEEKRPAAVETANRERGPLSDLTLVPVSEATSNTGAVTSAPLPSVDATLPVEAQRSDATALPSSEYSKVLAQAARISEPEYTTVDPRSLPPGLGALTQPVRSAPSQEREREPAAEVPEPASDSGDKPEERGGAPEARRTNPVPLKQPLPRLDDLRESGTVRLRLSVSDDGRVKEIDVLQGLSGATADVVDAVRRWRFKPATLNGQPVQGTFEAEIILNGQR